MNDPRTVLSIELSTPRGQVAVVRGAETVFSAEFTSERSHNSHVFPRLAEALEAAGDALDLIVVGTGPGSYTGVRIAIAAAQGVGLSRGVVVIGHPSITMPDGSDEAEATKFLVIGDARRGSFFAVSVKNSVLTDEVRLFDEAGFREHVARYREILSFDKSVPLDLPDVRLCVPSAMKLARHAASLSKDEIARLSSAALEPLYIREAFITHAKRPFAT